ncbi:putative bifunctional diguanylate cyclase/phosphodiesterase [Pseudidiomarina homiensis]|uniref:putative bifunctional diguanylate cyclase/phosphodiesterase n=1 Tax=Pseudidiomarina homiensis TaxID=364198 RepID=UPI00215B13A6|nr:EAL domain-containing protein [Pseudidiomarina homiensis]
MIYRRSLALTLVNVTLFVTISATFMFGLLGLLLNSYANPASAFERVISSTSGVVAIAVAFSLFGLAAKKRKIQVAFAIVVILAALHSLVVNLSLTSIFYLEFLHAIDAYFYPPVALTFLLLGVTLLLSPRQKIQRRWMRAFAVFLILLASAAIGLHFFEDGFAFLGPHPPVTSLAALSMFLIGVSLLLASNHRILLFDLNRNPAAWVTFVFVMTICSIWFYLSYAQIKEIRAEAIDTVQKVAKVRQQTIQVNLQVLNRLRERWAELQVSPTSDFARFDASTYLRDIPHYLGIHIIDQRGVPQWQQHRNGNRDYLEHVNHPAVQAWLGSDPDVTTMYIPEDEFKLNKEPLGLLLMPAGQQAEQRFYMLVVFDLMKLISPETRLLPDYLKIYAALNDERVLSFDDNKPFSRIELSIAQAQLTIPNGAPLALSVSLYAFDDLVTASNLRMTLALLGFMFSIAFLALAQQNRILRKHSHRLRKTQSRLHEQQVQMQLNEQQYRSLFAYHPDAVFSLDTDGIMTSVNDSVLRILDAEMNSVVGNHFSAFVHPAERSKAEENFQRTLQGEPRQYPLTVFNNQAQMIYLQITNLPININGHITGVFGIAKDVSKSRAKDEQLHILERSINVSTNGIVISDASEDNSPIIYTNDAFQKMSGYSANEIVGKSCDFLVGPKTDPEIIDKVRGALKERRECAVEVMHYRKDGTAFWDELQLAPVADTEGKITHFIGIHQDITERMAHKQQLAFQAEHDALTKLYNRHAFEARFAKVLQAAETTKDNCQWAVLFIDLDGFKPINEAMGLAAGDEVLKQVAKRLEKAINTPNFVARFGGDEFVVAISDASLQSIETMGEELLAELAEPYQIRQQKLYLTASIGVACKSAEGQSAVDLIQHADTAMTFAKRQGRNHLHFYKRSEEHSQRVDVHLRNRFQQAIDNEKLALYYQPIIDLQSGAIVGAEALMRWQLDDGSFVPPDKFIPMAEATGQIIPASEWAIEQACQDLKLLLEKREHMSVSVNLSALQFSRANFFEQIIASIKAHKLKNENLELELTESILMDDSNHAIKLIERFRNAGVAMSIDDFGTGFSSLSYLKKLPVNKLKIDRAFIQDIVSKSSDEAIVRGILAMARQLNMDVVAEGIETVEQAIRLTEMGCVYGQGYYFAKPKPLAELLKDLD